MAKNALRYFTHDLKRPVYLFEEKLGAGDTAGGYSFFIVKGETAKEVMTLAEYIKRAGTEGTREYETARDQVPYLQKELDAINN